MKGKTLVGAVTNILNKKVREEEAKDFALNQYGVLCAYLRDETVKSFLPKEKQVDLKTVKCVQLKYKTKLEKGLYPISITHVKRLIKNCEEWGYGNKDTCKYVAESIIEWLQLNHESLPILDNLESDLICIVHDINNGARYKLIDISYLTEN